MKKVNSTQFNRAIHLLWFMFEDKHANQFGNPRFGILTTIHRLKRIQRCSKATMYKTVKILIELGYIKKVSIGGQQYEYKLTGEGEQWVDEHDGYVRMIAKIHQETIEINRGVNNAYKNI